MAMIMTENGSLDWDQPLSSLLPSSASRKRRRIRPQGNPRPSPDLFSKLVNDLLVEILIRLPNPRFSCRCLVVCKRWRSVIDNPSFNRRFTSHHLAKYQQASLFLPAHDPQSILSFIPVPDEARPKLRVFDCFKDLLLCGFVKSNSELRRSYLICNPFTKQWIALPLAPEISGLCNVSAAGLVCQPCTGRNNYHLVMQLGDEQEPSFVYSEYRFRVVCLFQFSGYQELQVFCSESGKWTQVDLEMYMALPLANVLTWNEKLCWVQCDLRTRRVARAAYDPFCPYVLPESMHVPSAMLRDMRRGHGNFSVSQGAFHIIIFQVEFSTKWLSVWRQEEDCWTRQYETVLKTTTSSLWGDYELERCFVLDLHPEKPEIVFFQYLNFDSPDILFSCNLRTGMGEPEFFSETEFYTHDPGWRALQPRVSCWPTPIPRYEELRGMYDGSYDCWVQSNGTATLPSTIEECQPLVEQSGHRRKDKRSAAAVHSGQRKLKVVKGALEKKIIFRDRLKGERRSNGEVNWLALH